MPVFKKVSPEVFNSFQELIKQRIYTTAHPAVRWIFWTRLKILLSFMEGVAAQKVFDCGCGEGAFLPSLSASFPSVVAMDFDPRAAHKLIGVLKLRNISLLTGDMTRLPFPDQTFDAIFTADVLEHLPDLGPCVAELERVLKPEGSLLISAPTENLLYEVGRKVFGFQKPPDHYRTAREIEKIVSGVFDIRRKRFFPLNVAEAFSGFVLFRACKRPVKKTGSHV